MKLYLFSNGSRSGFARDAASFKKAVGKGMLRVGKRIVDEETTIPAGFRPCADDNTAIESIPAMRSLVCALSPRSKKQV